MEPFQRPTESARWPANTRTGTKATTRSWSPQRKRKRALRCPAEGGLRTRYAQSDALFIF
jgi:hypothetical protein